MNVFRGTLGRCQPTRSQPSTNQSLSLIMILCVEGEKVRPSDIFLVLIFGSCAARSVRRPGNLDFFYSISQLTAV